MGWYSHSYPAYVSVAERKEETARLIKKLQKKGQTVHPVHIEGRVIARTFWGKQWCKNLEHYSDYENRLPRGRSYVRHGSVIDLKIQAGEVTALVNGSSLYTVTIKIESVNPSQWKSLVKQCSGKIDSLIELLQGKFSKSVMEIITQPQKGLFPHPKEIALKCSCPDYASLCKHVAAVLYGIGTRLDEEPEALFLLRQANHLELIETVTLDNLSEFCSEKDFSKKQPDTDLSALFGIDIVESSTPTKLSIPKKHTKKNKITKKLKLKSSPKRS